MRHRISGKQLSRTTSHRRALRRNMAASLIEHGAIRTTEAKAKELRPFIERLITTARKGTLHARRQVIALLQDRTMVNAEGGVAEKTVVQKLFDEVAPAYTDRQGGYTRIIRLSDRRIGDGGVQVLLQLIAQSADQADESAGTVSRRRKRAAKRHEAAASSGQTETEESQEDASEETPDQSDEQKTDEEKEEKE